MKSAPLLLLLFLAVSTLVFAMRQESGGIVDVPARAMPYPRPVPALKNVRFFMPFAWLALEIVIVTAIIVDRRER